MAVSLHVTRWQGSELPSEQAVQQVIRRENLNGYTWSNAPYDEYRAHIHSFDKVLYVLAGSITWILPETNQELTTHAGDRLDLPRGTLHAARVGAQGVTCFEAHL